MNEHLRQLEQEKERLDEAYWNAMAWLGSVTQARAEVMNQLKELGNE